MLSFSRHNIFSRIKNSGNYFIVNLLSGNADILSPEEAEIITSLQNEPGIKDNDFTRELMDKGYITDEADENKLYRNRYLGFLDNREEDELQIFFVTNYSCNFACSYCYQDQYSSPGMALSNEIVDSFIRFVNTEFSGRKKYVTVFGGEPLLGSPVHKSAIEYLLTRINEAKMETCIVTNGFHLNEYVPLLKKFMIREIQVTLDGTQTTHDKRRFLKGGGQTFYRITEGIDSCLNSNIPVNLRMVADRENIGDLPGLAAYAIEKGWTTHPGFKTQIGRNYELHHCQEAADRLFDRISLYESIHELIRSHPHILQFHKPAYSVTKFLSENGKLPDPLFDSCPACKTEWAFDYSGKIYPCTATVGKSDECLGTFYPSVSVNRDAAAEWQRRDVLAIPECKSCNLQLACGGGCGSVSKNRSGSICSADCRPVKELMEMGFSQYSFD